jgi:hypothetical protein
MRGSPAHFISGVGVWGRHIVIIIQRRLADVFKQDIMKQSAFFFAFILLLGSCGSARYFTTPNDLRNMRGTLYLNKGKVVTGLLHINLYGFNRGTIRIKPEGASDYFKYTLEEVEGYRINNDYYALKRMRTTGIFGGGERLFFMRRLTPDESRIHLYEHITRENRNDGNGNSRVIYNEKFYVQLPTEPATDVWELESNKFTPNFDEKMSRYVADCPTLARKIANREEGYFFRQVSLVQGKRLFVIDNIIEEYNRCR